MSTHHLPASMTITSAAENKINQLINAEENSNDLHLRIYVTGGGCNGLQYEFAFDNQPEDDDRHIALTGQTGVLIDPFSYPYLQDATIDYADDLEGERFIVRNPNAANTCGCQKSFTARSHQTSTELEE